MRYIPFVAWFVCLAAVVLCLVTFIAGSGRNTMENCAILTFNTSSLGINQYHSPSTLDFSTNISSLLPPGITHPPSLTQYLGIKDWYSMHYLHTCYGFFAVSNSNLSLLTTEKINITCTHQPAGYTFDLNGLLRTELKPGVQTLADEIPESRIVTEPFYAMWQVGQVTGIIAFSTIPSTWAGTRRNNGYCVLWSLFSFLFFTLNAGLATHQILSVRSRLGESIVAYPTGFLGLTWSTCAAMFVVFMLMLLEWRFQLWTADGDIIKLYGKPEHCGWLSTSTSSKDDRKDEIHIKEKE